MFTCFTCKYACSSLACLVPAKTSRMNHILQNWSYWWLWAAVWVLGIKPGLLYEHPVLYQLSRLSSPHLFFGTPPPQSLTEPGSFSLWLDWLANKPQGCSFSASVGSRSQVNAASASGLISGPHACTTSTFNNWAIFPLTSSGLLSGYFFPSIAIAIVPIVPLLIPHRIIYTPFTFFPFMNRSFQDSFKMTASTFFSCGWTPCT